MTERQAPSPDGEKARLELFGLLGAGGLALWVQRHRRAPAVRAWEPSRHPTRPGAPLATRAFGRGPETVVLLHGLGATNDSWGRAYDRLGRTNRVLVPDLLGFGGSLDETRSHFPLTDHLAALDTMLAQRSPGAGAITLVAHSMGTRLALAWATQRHQQVVRVVCVGAPIYPNAGAARTALSASGPMAKLFLLDTHWAERACAMSCAHRTAAGWLAAVADRAMPVPIARRSPQHTWPAYREAVDQLILHVDWSAELRALASPATPVTFLWGDQDPIGDVAHARSILASDAQSVAIHPGADHHLPLTHPDVVVDLILDG